MKQILYNFFIVILIVVLTGCTDRIDLEDATLIVTLGLDLDEDNHLMVFERSLILSREAKSIKKHHMLLLFQ
ncbi:hypothetical protein [Brevibacillus laterosporus]|uniref:Ger(X)C family spore germination protein n=1 Tax=Brevibacillus laterosporus TaxID=1465 RepID=A0AAP8U6D1_BRELA|nr:hypothetical protein [Brevibacillus laterosporus]PPA89350.1 hypothetical protein C4A76_03475 [Brevibacillus laterosporus]PPB10588.1 hypothetical protein C4A77_05300 [Brevibacillus laterosporus]